MSLTPLSDVKQYARIDGSEEDTLLQTLTDSAESYLSHAGIDAGLVPAPMYRLAVCGLVLHWYANRNSADGSASPGFETGLRLVINQLKLISQTQIS